MSALRSTQIETKLDGIWQIVDSSTIGGIERHIETLATALNEVGETTHVLLYGDHGSNPWVCQLEGAGLTPTILGNSLTSLKAAIKQHRPRLIHTHGYKTGLLARPLAMLYGVPCVSTFHSGERGSFPVSAYQRADEATAFLASSIAVSGPIKNKLPKSAEIIHNFIKMPKVVADPTRHHKRIGFVGRMSHEKAPDTFCKLAEASEIKNASWHAYGEGEMRAQLEDQYGSYVTFHGLMTDMAPIWPTLDLLIIPSRAEGLPLAALEAMSHGIPVLASNVGALPHVIQQNKTGWLAMPEDESVFLKSLGQWANRSESTEKSMHTECINKIEQEFSVTSKMEAILEVYKSAGMLA